MSEKEILALTYYDTVDVYRKVATKNATTKITTLTYTKVHNDKKCAFSLKTQRLNSMFMIDNKNDVVYEASVFLDPSVLIEKGDKLEVIIGASGQTKIIYASDPMVYISHQEVKCTLHERA